MKAHAIERDDRGAIMVIALFFAIFALAMLYTLVGTAQAIFLREKLQDASDSAALAGAVLHARSMNLLVLINIVMAALLAILVTLKLIESVAILGIILAAALAWFTGGATLSAVPPLKNLQQQMHDRYSDLKPSIFDALKTLHSVADAVKKAAPLAAVGVVELDIANHAAPAVGVIVPPRLDLPVEDGSFAELCKEAGYLPGHVASEALDHAGIPVVPQLTDALASAVGALSGTFSSWFCSDSSGSSAAPSLSQTVKQSYPKVVTPDSELCGHVETDEDKKPRPSRDEVQAACDRSHDDEDAGKPDAATGECQSGVDCSISGPYEKRLKLAREQCDPTAAPAPFRYWYQQRTGHVEYEWTDKGWKRGEPVTDNPIRVGGDEGSTQTPCGPKAIASVAAGYNKVVHPHDDVTETLPACTTETAPFLPPPGLVRGAVEPRNFTEVTQILGCQKYETKDVPITAGDKAGSQSNDKSHKVLEEDVTLGDKNFQIRSLMFAHSDSAISDVVRLALWKRKDPDDPLALLRPLRGVSVAQAEYFYDGGEGRDAWMWNMNWRGRLRRFRLEDKEFDAINTACDALPKPVSNDCDNTLTAVANTVNLISH